MRYFLVATVVLTQYYFVMLSTILLYLSFIFINILFYDYYFWLQVTWDLSSPNRDQTVPREVDVRSLIHWATKEVSQYYFLMIMSMLLEILYIISLQISPQNYWFLKKMKITSKQNQNCFFSCFYTYLSVWTLACLTLMYNILYK